MNVPSPFGAAPRVNSPVGTLEVILSHTLEIYLTTFPHSSGVTQPDEAMRNPSRLSHDSLSRARTRLASGFTQHVAIALVACLLAIVLG